MESETRVFRIKICGIRNLQQAKWAAEAGADAIGLNFFAESRRSVTPQMAASISLGMRHQLRTVGVFVNAPYEEIVRCWRLVGFDVVQLHGDEPPELLVQLRKGPMAECTTIKAFQLRLGRVGFGNHVP